MKDVASPLSDIALYLFLMYGKYFLPEKGSGCVKRAEWLGTQKSLVWGTLWIQNDVQRLNVNLSVCWALEMSPAYVSNYKKEAKHNVLV